MRSFALSGFALLAAALAAACVDVGSSDPEVEHSALGVGRARKVAPSAVRPRGRDWRDVAGERLRRDRDQVGSAHEAALSGLTHVVAPPIWTAEQLDAGFAFVRGEKFVGEHRRLPWMYPQDGCFARAARMGAELEAADYEPPAKLYAFGNLEVPTRFDSTGAVTWWYHVAPIVEVDGVEYVIDPAVRPAGPMTRAEWEERIGSSDSTTCDPFTYTPDDSCAKPEHTDYSHEGLEESAGGWSYIDLETENLDYLGLQKLPLLDDRPPWVTPMFGEICEKSEECPAALEEGFAKSCSKKARIDGKRGCFYEKLLN